MANYVYATDPRKPIPIGVQGENDARTAVFDIHKWIEDYGNGSALLVHQRPGDAEPYPVTTAQKAGTVEWTVQQADIIAGAPGRAQLSYQVGENIVARSPIYLTIAADEITNTTLADYDPAESWLNAILGAVQEAGDITDEVQAAKNAAAQAAASAEKAEEYSGKPPVITGDIWYTWDADAGEYKSTGEPSRGPAGPQGEKGDIGAAAGFGVPTITVDDTTGTPSATVEASGPDTAKVFTFAFSGLKGETGPRGEQGPQGKTGTQGPQGTAAGFGEATASVDSSTGVPDVTVSTSGPDTAKVFDFQFSGLKGETGAAAGFGQITATVGAEVGTPSVSVEASGPDTAKNLAFAFTNLKGEPGQSVGSIQRTAGTGAPGTTDTYTMYDDGGGVIGTFTVYNGTDGTGSGDFKADGSVPMTGDLNAGEHKIINVAAPTADGDAANKAYVDSQSAEIVKTARGSVINVSDSADYRLLGLKLYGKSVQDGTPTPEAPVEIESAGNSGSITVTLSDGAEQSQTLNYPTPNGLPGIPVESGGNFTDVDGQQWVCDEVDFARGKYVQRIKYIVLTGDMDWSPNNPWDQQAPDIFHYYANITGKKVDTQDGSNNLLCPTFECKTVGGNSLINTECIYSLYTNEVVYVFLAKSRASTPDSEGFRGWIDQNQPVVYYILQNPIETDLTPEQLTAYAALTTYKPNTTVTTDSSPAAGIEVKYLTDSGVSEVLDYYASKADLDGKQDKLTGTTGQFVGFDADGNAEAQEITAADVGAVAADGSTAMAGDFDAGGHRVTNVGAPTAAGDAVRQSDLQAVSDEIDAIIAGTTPVTIPAATETKAGVVKPGEHLSVQADGTLNAEWPDLSGYLTEIPAEYATQSWVNGRGFLTAVPAEYVTDTELTQTLSGYALKGFTWTGTLTVAGWSGSAAPYTQAVTISGMQATDNPFLGPNYTSTDVDTVKAQEEAFSLISRIDSGAGTATIYIYEDSKPEVDIPILVKVVR